MEQQNRQREDLYRQQQQAWEAQKLKAEQQDKIAKVQQDMAERGFNQVTVPQGGTPPQGAARIDTSQGPTFWQSSPAAPDHKGQVSYPADSTQGKALVNQGIKADSDGKVWVDSASQPYLLQNVKDQEANANQVFQDNLMSIATGIQQGRIKDEASLDAALETAPHGNAVRIKNALKGVDLAKPTNATDALSAIGVKNIKDLSDIQHQRDVEARQAKHEANMEAYQKYEMGIRNQQLDLEKKRVALEEGRAKSIPELANTPEQFQRAAMDAVLKAGVDANATLASVKQGKDIIREALAGNKAASASVDPEGNIVLYNSNGFHRVVNKPIGAGSAWDQMAGKIGKGVNGIGQTQSVLHDMNRLFDVIGNDIQSKYNGAIDATNATTKSQFQHRQIYTPESRLKSGKGVGEPITVRDPQTGRPVQKTITKINPDGTFEAN